LRIPIPFENVAVKSGYFGFCLKFVMLMFQNSRPACPVCPELPMVGQMGRTGHSIFNFTLKILVAQYPCRD
jgi:hypothetical protein